MLLIVYDDVGMDLIGGTYAEVPDAPSTPNFDRLATEGVFFRNAWAHPYCSPTRASILTGRYGFRTGLGQYISSFDSWGLPPDTTTLADLLGNRRYACATVGKWHVGAKFGAGQGLLHPLYLGFDSYRGSMGGPIAGPWGPTPRNCFWPFSYWNWAKSVEGIESCTWRYMTTDTANDAVAFLASAPSPWFLYVAFDAVAPPLHDPTGQLPPTATRRDKAKAMMEVLDGELGRLLSAANYPNPDLWVVLTADNGTISEAAYGQEPIGCFGTQHSKRTLYEGGVNVPLVIAGPSAVPRATDVIANATDVFATVCDLAGVPSQAEDAVSLMPVVKGSEAPVRPYVYSEIFRPNGLPLSLTYLYQAASDGRYKLIRRNDFATVTETLFDLLADPCELEDLLPATVGSEPYQAQQQLGAYLDSLDVLGAARTAARYAAPLEPLGDPSEPTTLRTELPAPITGATGR